MSRRDYCPHCTEYWVRKDVYSNTDERSETYVCARGHTWAFRFRFDGYAADGTRCYTSAADRPLSLKDEIRKALEGTGPELPPDSTGSGLGTSHTEDQR